jgi:predicted amidohydrolase YtcJ
MVRPRSSVIGAIVVAMAIAALTGATASAGTVVADVILHGGVVVTLDPAHPVAQAVALRDDRIVAVGSNQRVLRMRGRGTKLVDLRGRTVLPGFNDAHAHWIGDRDGPSLGSAEDAVGAVLAQGWTSISELFVDEDRLHELRQLDEAGKLRVRVNGYLPVNFHDDKYGLWFDGTYTPRQEFSDHLRVAGAKVFVDRAAPAQMLLSTPHTDQPGFLGHSSWTQQELTDIVGELDHKGWQVAIHTAGDGAHDLVLNAFAAALAGRPNALRHRIEHVMVVRDDQIQRMRQLGLLASIQLTFFQSDWLTGSFWTGFEPALGAARLAWAGRWRDLLEAGVHTIGSTDTPWFNEDFDAASPLEAVEMAVTRVGRDGTKPHAWMLAQRIRVAEALRLLTRDAAYGTLDETRKGSITAGKYADLVVLGRNPLAVPPAQIGEIPVLATIVGGKGEYCVPAAAALCS